MCSSPLCWPPPGQVQGSGKCSVLPLRVAAAMPLPGAGTAAREVLVPQTFWEVCILGSGLCWFVPRARCGLFGSASEPRLSPLVVFCKLSTGISSGLFWNTGCDWATTKWIRFIFLFRDKFPPHVHLVRLASKAMTFLYKLLVWRTQFSLQEENSRTWFLWSAFPAPHKHLFSTLQPVVNRKKCTGHLGEILTANRASWWRNRRRRSCPWLVCPFPLVSPQAMRVWLAGPEAMLQSPQLRALLQACSCWKAPARGSHHQCSALGLLLRKQNEPAFRLSGKEAKLSVLHCKDLLEGVEGEPCQPVGMPSPCLEASPAAPGARSWEPQPGFDQQTSSSGWWQRCAEISELTAVEWASLV